MSKTATKPSTKTTSSQAAPSGSSTSIAKSTGNVEKAVESTSNPQPSEQSEAAPIPELDANNPAVADYQASFDGFRSAIHKYAEAIDPQSYEATCDNLKGKTVVITGAGSGFGRAFAEKAASYGAHVFVSDLSVEAVKETAKRIGVNGGLATAYPKSCNTASWESQVDMFEAAVKKYGLIDVVVPNAGVGEVGELLKDEFVNGKLKKPNMTTVEVNLLGAMYTARIGFYHLSRNTKNKNKAIVFLGSMASQNGLPKGPMYGLAKHGILGFFRSIYWDCKAANIRANIICPWFVSTPIIAPLNRLALFGLPLGTIDDVISGMLKSASDPDFNGYQVVIDANGILGVPFEATSIGPDGYYAEFGNRAVASINLERKIKDLGLIVGATVKYWTPKKLWVKLSLLAALTAIVRKRVIHGRAP